MSCELLASNGIGSIVDGKFPLLRWLGGTDSSSVFLTELQGDPPRKAAIKLIPAGSVDADARVAEWVVDKNLSHPHLLRLFHAGRCETDGEPYIYVVTEYADEVLSEILTGRSLTPEETAEMLGPVLDALSWLHARDRIHGHFHPSNILVVDESLKLSIDHLHSDGEFGRPALVSSKYDAPEMATGLLSPATDVWSLGVVIVQALFPHPFSLDGSRGEDPVVPATIPQPFFSIARRCLQVDPARRCTLTDVRAALDPAKAPKPARLPGTQRSAPGPRRHIPTTVLAGAAVVLGGAIGAVIAVSHYSRPSPSPVQQDAAPQASAPAPAAAEPQPPAPEASRPEPPPAHTPAAVPLQESPQSTSAAAPSPAPASPAPASPAAASAQPAPAPLQGSLVQGAIASRAVPDVPQHILDTVQGHVRVRIRVDVDPQGQVSNAAIDDSGPSRYFAAKALAAARDWKFTPAQVNGRAVASTWMLHFSFAQTGTTIAPAETAP